MRLFCVNKVVSGVSSERIMSDEFDGLDATEKAGTEGAHVVAGRLLHLT